MWPLLISQDHALQAWGDTIVVAPQWSVADEATEVLVGTDSSVGLSSLERPSNLSCRGSHKLQEFSWACSCSVK